MNLKIIFIAPVLTFGLYACGSHESQSKPSGGSWSSDIGGSFFREKVDSEEFQSIKALRVYRVVKPVALGIEHHFLMVRSKQKTWTLGLINSSDESFLEELKSTPKRAAKKISWIKTLSKKGSIREFKNFIDDYFKNSPYNKKMFYGSSMILTPLTGRPCKNVVDKIVRFLQKN